MKPPCLLYMEKTKSHMKTINQTHQLQNGEKNVIHQVNHILYQIFNISSTSSNYMKNILMKYKYISKQN